MEGHDRVPSAKILLLIWFCNCSPLHYFGGDLPLPRRWQSILLIIKKDGLKEHNRLFNMYIEKRCFIDEGLHTVITD